MSFRPLSAKRSVAVALVKLVAMFLAVNLAANLVTGLLFLGVLVDRRII